MHSRLLGRLKHFSHGLSAQHLVASLVSALIISSSGTLSAAQIGASFSDNVSAFDGRRDLRDIARQQDGSLILVGNFFKEPLGGFPPGPFEGFPNLLRLTPDLKPDVKFGPKGTGLLIIPSIAPVRVLIQRDGKIVLLQAGSPITLVRLNTDGSLDDSFGSAGTVTDDVGPITATDMLLDRRGRIVVTGRYHETDVREDFAVVRYKPDGTRDPKFGQEGKVVFPIAEQGGQRDAVITEGNDGTLYVAGTVTRNESDSDFALLAVRRDGGLPNGFGNNGYVTTDFKGLKDVVRSIAIDPNTGRIIVVGAATVPAEPPQVQRHAALARYNARGRLDRRFGEAGIVTIPGVATNSEAQALTVDQNGTIIIAAQFNSEIEFRSRVVLVRYNRHGQVDVTHEPLVLQTCSPGDFGSFTGEARFVGRYSAVRVLQSQDDDSTYVAGGGLCGFAAFEFVTQVVP